MTNWKMRGEGGGMLGCVMHGLRVLMRMLSPTRCSHLVRLVSTAACTLMLALAVVPMPCGAQTLSAPDVIPYQGTLVNGDGEPLGSPTPRNYEIVFRIYDAFSNGTLLWSEAQTVTVDAGRYSVHLGRGVAYDVEPRPALGGVFRTPTASDRYLEVMVRAVGPGKADSILSPRTRFLPGPYVLSAQHARTAERLLSASNTRVLTLVGARVGINTTNPTASVDVSGTALASSIRVNGDGRVGGVATADSWIGGGAVPVGSIILWSGTSVDQPDGWALCDGSVVNGYRTPDLRGRFVVGAGTGPGLTERRLGATGGAETHSLSAAEAPQHSHWFDPDPQWTWSNGGHTHSFLSEAANSKNYGYKAVTQRFFYSRNWGDRNSLDRYTLETGTAGAHNHSVDVPPTESGSYGMNLFPHANMPPFYVLAYLVRIR
jgi:microcystin-dependent protein